MERLRRLRSPSTAPPSATALPGRLIVTTHTQRPAGNAKGKRDMGPVSAKSPQRHRDGPLDLEMLTSKLQQYAQTRGQDDEDDPAEAEDALVEETDQAPVQVVKGTKGTGVEAQTDNKRPAGGAADSAFDNESGTTSQQSSQNGASTCPSIVIHPPDDDEPSAATEPSDFALFLQQAQDDERTRKANGLHALPKPKQEPPPNPFYSNNLASPLSVPSKLAEIQETGDEESRAETDELSSQHTSSSASSGSNDFAATDTQPTRANTASLGRHVSFCEPAKLRERSDSHGSAYHARGFESPKAPGLVARKRKSLRKMVKDYIRHL